MEKKTKIGFRGSYRNHVPLYGDTKAGLGYGLAVPSGRDVPRPANKGFPYREEDPYEEEDEDATYDADVDLLKMLQNKTAAGYLPVDPLAARDPFSFAGMNSGLTTIHELAAGTGMVPFPTMYSKKQAVAGGFTQYPAYDERPYKRTGTTQGYASPPPPSEAGEPDDIIIFSLKDILDDDEIALQKVAAVQKKIALLNSLGKRHEKKAGARRS